MYFPAEVTASYVAIQGSLTANNVLKTEDMYFMAGVIVALTIINVANPHWKIYEINNVILHFVLGTGFIIWGNQYRHAALQRFPVPGRAHRNHRTCPAHFLHIADIVF